MPKVIHFEIPAEDTKRAVAFFANVFGWKMKKYGGEGVDYWLANTGDDKEPGINGAILEEDEMHPAIINTIGVPSFEEAVNKIKAAGGQVIGPRMTVPNVGYMTYGKDTESNVLGIMQTDPKAK